MRRDYYLVFTTSENPVILKIRDGAFAEARKRQCPLVVDMLVRPTLPPNGWPNCAGMIAQVWSEELWARLRRARFPVVNVSNWAGPLAGVGNVLSDDVEVGRVGARHLLALGYRHYLLIGQVDRRFSTERLAGFKEVAEANGAKVRTIEISGQVPAELWSPAAYMDAVWEQIGAVIEALPMRSAIFGANDWVVWPVLRLLEERLPDRAPAIAVLGVDNTHESVWDPRLTMGLSSVIPGFHRVGREALAALMEHEGDRGAVARVRVRVPPEGVATRASTAGPACDDPLTARMARLFWTSLREGSMIPIEEMARRHGMTRRTLERKFTHYYGYSARDYVVRLRMELARELLRETRLTVSEIAERCGFSDTPAFSAAFRTHVGRTPREYRAEGVKKNARNPTA